MTERAVSRETRRQPRDRRRAGVSVCLSERDRGVLAAVARFRLVRTGDLVRLFFRGVRADTAAVRLRRLYDASYLTVYCSDRSQQSIYALGPEGRRWVAAQVEEARARGAKIPPLRHAGGEPFDWRSTTVAELWATSAWRPLREPA